jgi:hypothetical protein
VDHEFPIAPLGNEKFGAPLAEKSARGVGVNVALAPACFVAGLGSEGVEALEMELLMRSCAQT